MAADMKPTVANTRRTDDHSAVRPVAFKSIDDPIGGQDHAIATTQREKLPISA